MKFNFIKFWWMDMDTSRDQGKQGRKTHDPTKLLLLN